MAFTALKIVGKKDWRGGKKILKSSCYHEVKYHSPLSGARVKAEVAWCRVKSRYLFVLVGGFEDGITGESPGSRREELWRQLETLSHLFNVLFFPQRSLCKTRIQIICFSVRFDPLSLSLLGSVSLCLPWLWLCSVPGLGRDFWHKNNLPSWFCKFFCIVSAHCSHSVAAAALWYWIFSVSHVS